MPDPATAGGVGHSQPQQAGREKPAPRNVRLPRTTAAIAKSTELLPESVSELPSTATAPPAALATPDTATKVHLIDTLGKLPLSFEPNQGTTDPQVKFLSRGRVPHANRLRANARMIETEQKPTAQNRCRGYPLFSR